MAVAVKLVRSSLDVLTRHALAIITIIIAGEVGSAALIRNGAKNDVDGRIAGRLHVGRVVVAPWQDPLLISLQILLPL
ncbi:MAG: hypothetical protein Q9190_003799 [Brigantiaea leucoxantha]